MNKTSYVCPLCNNDFGEKHTLKSHLERINKCTPLTDDNKIILEKYVKQHNITIDKYECSACHLQFSRNSVLKTHKCKAIKNKQKKEDPLIKMVTDIYYHQQQQQLEFRKEITAIREAIPEQSKLRNEISAIREAIPEQFNSLFKTESQKLIPNNLLININENEDMFKKLETLMGNEIEVLNYIVDCALGDSKGVGSGKLIKRLYVRNGSDQGPVFGWSDKKETKVKFRGDNGEWKIEPKNEFSERLMEYLDACYTKTFQKLQLYKQENGVYPCEWGTYQLTTWNEMNAKRADPKFRKVLMRNLNIPDLSEVSMQALTPKIGMTQTITYVPEMTDSRSSGLDIRDTETESSNLQEQIPSKVKSSYEILTQAAPPTDYIPGAPPELVRMRYVSPNTISVKDLIHNVSKKKTIA